MHTRLLASVLGFPSYYVHVDGLSPVSDIREDRFAFLWRKQEEVRRTILNIDARSRPEVAQVADLLFQELTRANPLLEVAFEQETLDAAVARLERPYDTFPGATGFCCDGDHGKASRRCLTSAR